MVNAAAFFFFTLHSSIQITQITELLICCLFSALF